MADQEKQTTQSEVTLSEERIRQIVREELAKRKKQGANQLRHNGSHTQYEVK